MLKYSCIISISRFSRWGILFCRTLYILYGVYRPWHFIVRSVVLPNFTAPQRLVKFCAIKDGLLRQAGSQAESACQPYIIYWPPEEYKNDAGQAGVRSNRPWQRTSQTASYASYDQRECYHVGLYFTAVLPFNIHIKTAEQRTIIQQYGDWPLMGGLLHLVQRGGAWAGWSPAQSSPGCTKCNSPSINSQCTNFILFYVAL